MDMTEIQKKLNKYFEPGNSQWPQILVFWYDDKGMYKDSINDLKLDDAEVLQLNKNNGFKVKYTIVRKYPEKNFLVYAPYAKPADSDETNELLALQLYEDTKFYYADAIADLCEKYHIDLAYKHVLEEEQAFWGKEKNLQAFLALASAGFTYSDNAIRLGVMAVICGVKALKFDEIVKKILFSGDFKDTNKYLKEFAKAKVEGAFWHNCSLEYGLDEDDKSLTDLMLTFVYSYFKQCVGALPNTFDQGNINCTNSAAVFMANVLVDSTKKNKIDDVLDKLSEQLNIPNIIAKEAVENYYTCDLFRAVDFKVLRYFIERVVDGVKLLSETEKAVLRGRSTTMHFSLEYKKYYKAIEYANDMLEQVALFNADSSSINGADNILSAYTKSWCNVDVAYRKFNYYYDQCTEHDVKILQDKIENVYVQKFLEPLCALWSNALKVAGNYNALPEVKQTDFYSKFIQPKEDNMVAVIISDALRYECGKELCSHLNDDSNIEAKIMPMLANVPTFTSLGMASLLPNKKVSLISKNNALLGYVDDTATVSTDDRARVLASYTPASSATTYKDIMNMNKTQLRDTFKDTKVFYIYHNLIDATGDKSLTEDNVFNEVKTSFENIHNLILKLGRDKSVVKFYVTADHGFIYRKSNLESKNKVVFPASTLGNEGNKRFVITEEQMNVPGVVSLPLGKTHEGWYINAPYSCDIFSRSGSGQKFVHGGMSLQEMVVPIIEVKFDRYKVEKNKVKVLLHTTARKITSEISYIAFLQTERVTDVLLPRDVHAWIEDANGSIISNIALIRADRRSDDVNERIFHEKFVLPKKKYNVGDTYALVIADAIDNEVLSRYPINIDIVEQRIRL